MDITSLTEISIKNNPKINEALIQDIIAENPSILGLDNVELKDKERRQPHAGRLDILLQDSDASRRYEVEIQLGKTDPSHIIRTIEYWDIERKRYPYYEHCAVIVAEDITTRFLNVIQLFNGHIPIMAIQMKAYEVGEKIGLVFTRILDEITIDYEEEEETEKEITDRAFWEKKSTKENVKIADEILELIHNFDKSFSLTYKKPYIGLARNGEAQNFTIFRGRKNSLIMLIKLKKTTEIEELLESSSLDVMEYAGKQKRYRIRLSNQDVANEKEIISKLLKMSYDEWNG